MGGSDGRGARDELWRRYDDGAIGAKELEARLRLVDRGGDDAALQAAVDGPISELAPRRRSAIIGGVGTALVAAVVLPLVFLGGDGDGGATIGTATTGGAVAPPVTPPVGGPDCPELADAIEAIHAAAVEDLPVPSLLSDPPGLPPGYEVDDDEEIVPGTDPDIAFSVLAGTPPPTAIRGRTLRGDLEVAMRAFQFDSVEDAVASGDSVIASGVCTYGAEGFAVPDRPELNGSVVEGPIPTTAFVSFRIGDRRVSVSVRAPGDGTDADVAEAKLLAGQIAALELDAARGAAPPAGPVTTIPAG